MTEVNDGRQEPAYQLNVSRIFAAPPPAVRRAFTDPDVREQWVPADHRSIPGLIGAAGGGPLSWAEQPGPAGSPSTGTPAPTPAVRVELHDEPGNRTRLELRAGPYTAARETEARAWWDTAFSHLDTVLERAG
jgi:hypothetical protein